MKDRPPASEVEERCGAASAPLCRASLRCGGAGRNRYVRRKNWWDLQGMQLDVQTSCAYARRNPLALSATTMENTTKCRLSFSMEQLRQGDAHPNRPTTFFPCLLSTSHSHTDFVGLSYEVQQLVDLSFFSAPNLNWRYRTPRRGVSTAGCPDKISTWDFWIGSSVDVPVANA